MVYTPVVFAARFPWCSLLSETIAIIAPGGRAESETRTGAHAIPNSRHRLSGNKPHTPPGSMRKTIHNPSGPTTLEVKSELKLQMCLFVVVDEKALQAKPCTCICIYICIYMHMHVNVCVCWVYVHVHAHENAHACMLLRTCLCVHACGHLCNQVSTYARMRECIQIDTYMYTYTWTW